MTLPFSKTINGRPSFFVDKIWAGLIQSHLCNYSDQLQYVEQFVSKFSSEWESPELTVPAKIHTIRRDLLDSWKPGRKIHMAIGNRTKDRFQFAPVLEVISVQEISIRKDENDTFVFVDGSILGTLWDGHYDSIDSSLHSLAINDGFENVREFLDYFNHDFRGKIIHWTPLKYKLNTNHD